MSDAEKATPSGEDTALEKRARELLRESAARVDASTRSRLARARATAVEAAKGEDRSRRGYWVPAGALAAAAAIAFLAWSARERAPEPQVAENVIDDVTETPSGAGSHAQSPLDDLEILATNESFEVLEDLEFFAAIDLDDAGADIG